MADASKVLVGAAAIWLASQDTAKPADTIELGTSWGGTWVNPGYTDEGLTLSHDKDIVEHFVEEETDPVLTIINRTNLRVMFAMVEDTLENIKYAYGGGTITTVAAATGIMGKKSYAFSSSYEVLALGFEGMNSYGFYRRVYIPRVMSVGEVETPYRRADGKRVYPVTFRAMADGPSIKRSIYDKTAAALP